MIFREKILKKQILDQFINKYGKKVVNRLISRGTLRASSKMIIELQKSTLEKMPSNEYVEKYQIDFSVPATRLTYRVELETLIAYYSLWVDDPDTAVLEVQRLKRHLKELKLVEVALSAAEKFDPEVDFRLEKTIDKAIFEEAEDWQSIEFNSDLVKMMVILFELDIKDKEEIKQWSKNRVEMGFFTCCLVKDQLMRTSYDERQEKWDEANGNIISESVDELIDEEERLGRKFAYKPLIQ